jgi:hypothetical protein
MKVRTVDNDGLERELSRHLGPVKAPDDLWDRVHGGHRVNSRRSYGMRWQWAAAAAAIVAVVAGITVWQNRTLSDEELAVRALSRAPEQLDFRSEDPTELRAWVKDGTGLDIPLTGRAAPAVRLIGASARKGPRRAEIAYRVGTMDVSLVVSKAPPEEGSRHTFKKGGSYHGANFQSWTMRGQMYTIAASDAKMGCVLCHSTGAPRTLVN